MLNYMTILQPPLLKPNVMPTSMNVVVVAAEVVVVADSRMPDVDLVDPGVRPVPTTFSPLSLVPTCP